MHKQWFPSHSYSISKADRVMSPVRQLGSTLKYNNFLSSNSSPEMPS